MVVEILKFLYAFTASQIMLKSMFNGITGNDVNSTINGCFYSFLLKCFAAGEYLKKIDVGIGQQTYLGHYAHWLYL